MALARSWRAAGGELAGVVARTARAARSAAARLNTRGYTVGRPPSECGILVLAVPDDAIAGVARDLAGRIRCRFAFHLSGALPASILSPLGRGGASLGSIHPLRAFAGDSREDWKGALVALEGQSPALAAGGKIAAALGGEGHRIQTKSKPLYHAAATLAAGGTAALLSIASRAAVDAGLPARRTRAALSRLSAEAATAAASRPFPEAFTGPIARRDAETVRAHRAAASHRADFLELYRLLAREILDTTSGRGREAEIREVLGMSGASGGRAASAKRARRPAARGSNATISRVFPRPKGS
jgi:predicted short-subunit dehydrogenase-like oxidoreductase (DUF2520 family)